MGKRARFDSGIKLVRKINTGFEKQYYNVDFRLKRSTMKLITPVPKSLPSKDRIQGLRTCEIDFKL